MRSDETKLMTGATAEQIEAALRREILAYYGGDEEFAATVLARPNPYRGFEYMHRAIEHHAALLVPIGYAIVPRSLLETVRDLLDDAHDPGGSLSGRFAIEGKWQDVENALAEVQP